MKRILGKNLRIFGYQVNLLALIAAAVLCLFSFRWDGNIFTSEALPFEVPLPLDYDAVPVMFGITKILTFVVYFVVFQVFYWVVDAFLKKDKRFLLNFALPAGLLFAFYAINYIICQPGVFNIDDQATYGLATRYFPYYWQNYITSIYYMVGMTVLPFESGIMLMTDVFTALIFAYFFFRLTCVLENKKYAWLRFLLLIVAVCPVVNYITLHAVRPNMYALLNLLVLGYLVFERLQGRPFNLFKLAILALGFGTLIVWRMESIVYFLLAPLLVWFAYRGSIKWKAIIAFIVATVACYSVINIPQKIGNERYYGKDYMIVSTVRSLSVLLNLPETYTSYEGVEQDIENIDDIISVDEIKGLPFRCIAYQSWNTIINQGYLSQTNTYETTQDEYLKSFFNIIKNNPSNFMKERLDLFLETNRMKDGLPPLFGEDIKANREPTLAQYWIFSQSLRDAEIVPGEMQNTAYYQTITFQKQGWENFYSVILPLVIALALLVYAIAKKKWLLLLLTLTILLREAAIFLTSPDAMIVYYIPSTLFSLFLLAVTLICGVYERKTQTKLKL